MGLEQRPKTRFQLITMVYKAFKRYRLHTHYTLSACEVAFSILRNYRRRKSPPYARRLFLKLSSQSYKLDDLILRIPTEPRRFIQIPLESGEYQTSFLRDKALKRGSVTIAAEKSVLIAFSKISDENSSLREDCLGYK